MRQLITVTFYKNHCLKGDAFLCMLILSLDNRINIQCMKYKLSHCKNHSCVKITYTQYTQCLMLLANLLYPFTWYSALNLIKFVVLELGKIQRALQPEKNYINRSADEISNINLNPLPHLSYFFQEEDKAKNNCWIIPFLFCLIIVH